jgi:DNA polymerase-3 subunit epsilon
MIEFLAGAVLISHNVVFDLLFIKEEFNRLGHTLPTLSSICTLELARQLVPEPKSRRLPDVCRELGLTYGGSRSALEEAKATRLVFLQGLKQLKIQSIKDLGITGQPPEKSLWPDIPSMGRSYIPGAESSPEPAPAPPPDTMQNLVERADAKHQETVNLDQYLILLDQILEDRVITDDESQALTKMETELNLFKTEIEGAHKAYLKELLIAAWRDGKITQGEKEDLELVRKLLSISFQDYAELMQKAKKEAKSSPEPAGFLISLDKIQGMSVYFASPPLCKVRGMVPSEMFAQSIAMENGLTAAQQLSSDLDFLVVPDREKSQVDLEEAQELGVRIIAEPVFWRMIGIDIQ